MHIAYQILRGATALIGLMFFLIALRWLAQPQLMSIEFSVIPSGLLGWASLRADFGSFFMVAGITAGLAAFGGRGANHYLCCCGMLMTFAALGRLVGFATDGIPSRGVAPLMVELFTIAVLVGLAFTRFRLKEESA